MKASLLLLPALVISQVLNCSGQLTNNGDIWSFIINLSNLATIRHPMYPPGRIENDTRYDFIIVGSGPAGSALANRLSENPFWNVLLLESGEEPSWITDIPLACGSLAFSDYNWGYRTEHQDGLCEACENGTLQYSHGHALGGSTIINFMLYVRGNKLDFDRWAAMGNPGWSYDEVFPYFLKSEASHVSIRDEGYHNNDGVIPINDVPFKSRLAEVYVEASQQAGHPLVDNNGRTQLGISYVQSATENGMRCSAENKYLRPIRHRKNLKILTGSRATKILINERTRSAYGVEYFHRGKFFRALANKEVISSAGSLNSPQLLMLSGIGPRAHLEEIGIPVLQDLAVGTKMYDHIVFPSLIVQLNESISLNLTRELSNTSTYLQYLDGKGPLAATGGIETLTYLRTNASTDPDPTYPDMEYVMLAVSVASDNGAMLRKVFNIGPDLYDEVYRPLESKYAYQVFPTIIHPRSLSRIELRSRNPLDAPRFYANFFTDPENHDMTTLIAGIREFQKIIDTPAMRRYNATLWSRPVPGCRTVQYDTDEYWECTARNIIAAFFHQSSSCKMGPRNDTDAIVDTNLKVHGINRLRVVDTSVIPLAMTSHTAAVGYMIGEKAADIIKKDWNDSNDSWWFY